MNYTMDGATLRAPCGAWRVPGGGAISEQFSEWVGDWADIVVLTDGRTVLITDDGGAVAAIYASLDAAFDGQPNEELERVLGFSGKYDD